MVLRLVLVCSAVLAVAGCHNHPLIDDRTRLSTYDVVNKVRCEAALAIQAHFSRTGMADAKAKLKAAQRALKEKQKDYKAKDEEVELILVHHDARIKRLNRLVDRNNEIQSMVATLDQVLAALSKQLESATTPGQIEAIEALIDKTSKRIGAVTDEALFTAKFAEQVEKDIAKEVARITNEKILINRQKRQKELSDIQKSISKAYEPAIRFGQATLAMEFEFEITENNNAVAESSVTWPIHFGTFTLAASAGREKKRVSERTVSAAASFKNLNQLSCHDARLTDGSNRATAYPVTGTIGMAEFIDQYFKISDSIGIKTGNESFRDKLTFTTKIKGGFKPSIELAPVSPSRVSAFLDLNADRQDIHEVTVAVYPAESRSKGRPAPAVVNIGVVPEVTLRGAKDALDRYLKLDRNSESAPPRAGN